MLNRILLRKHLEKDEKVVQVIHRHWLLGVTYLFWPTVAYVSCWAVFYKAPHQMIFYFALFGSLAAGLWWIRNFFDYFLDAWIVTDQGIIDLEWLGLFHRKSARLLYSDMQGVSNEVNGIGGTLFRYGTLTVEKISTGAGISLPHVQNPRQVETIILRSMEEYMMKKNLKNAKHVQEVLATVIAEQYQLQSLQGGKKQTPNAETPPAPKKKGFASRTIR